MATTPLMSLSLPSPSSTAGPSWASQLNAALAIVDGHTHVAGSGARVPSAGLNINAALAFNGFDAATVRSLRLVNQAAPLALGTDVGCVYESGGNLYYNSAAGQQVQITAGAALNAASVGAIGGDYATSSASAFYTAASTTFSFWSAANKYASLDAGNVILREPGATSPFGVTLKSPGSLAASYALTMPAALPAATKILTVSSAGSVGVSLDAAAPTFAGNVGVGGTLGVTGLATLTGGASLGAPITGMTRASLPAVGQQASAGSGVFSTSSASFVDVTNLTATLTTTGRPVILNVQSDGSGGASSWGQTGASTGSLFGRILRDGVEIARWQAYASAQNNQAASYTHLDVGATAAAHTYKVQILAQSGTVVTQYAQLVAYEL